MIANASWRKAEKKIELELDKASGQGLDFQFNNSRVRFFRACLFLAFIVYILTDKINIRENIMEVSVFPEMHYTYQKEKKRK
jgi:hypothetical protein